MMWREFQFDAGSLLPLVSKVLYSITATLIMNIVSENLSAVREPVDQP